MAHLLMYSTNYTVCRRSVCLSHVLKVHLQHHRLPSESPYTTCRR